MSTAWKLRDEVVVIFAGYTKEMGDLISLNPGLASRVKVRISFPNYSKDELWSILELMADEWGMNLADGVRSVFDRKMAKAMQRNDFGNARSVRTFLEDAMVAQAARLVGFGGIDETFDVADERLSTLEPCDFERSGCASDTARRSVGLVCICAHAMFSEGGRRAFRRSVALFPLVARRASLRKCALRPCIIERRF